MIRLIRTLKHKVVKPRVDMIIHKTYWKHLTCCLTKSCYNFSYRRIHNDKIGHSEPIHHEDIFGLFRVTMNSNSFKHKKILGLPHFCWQREVVDRNVVFTTTMVARLMVQFHPSLVVACLDKMLYDNYLFGRI